jgi:hypothetical protein
MRKICLSTYQCTLRALACSNCICKRAKAPMSSPLAPPTATSASGSRGTTRVQCVGTMHTLRCTAARKQAPFIHASTMYWDGRTKILHAFPRVHIVAAELGQGSCSRGRKRLGCQLPLAPRGVQLAEIRHTCWSGCLECQAAALSHRREARLVVFPEWSAPCADCHRPHQRLTQTRDAPVPRSTNTLGLGPAFSPLSREAARPVASGGQPLVTANASSGTLEPCRQT